jgi:hypothetical protein
LFDLNVSEPLTEKHVLILIIIFNLIFSIHIINLEVGFLIDNRAALLNHILLLRLDTFNLPQLERLLLHHHFHLLYLLILFVI